jgi:pheromone shutdown protein TraB
MDEKYKYIEPLIESIEAYSKTSIELVKLKTVDKVADGTSSMVAWLPVIIALILFFIIVNFGLALWIGAMLEMIYMGFFIVAGFYALVGVILYIVKDKWIKKPLYGSMINQMLN